MSRLGLVATLLVAVALAVPASASAHAVLDGSNPDPGQRLEVAPRTIELRFSGPVKVLSNSIQVLSSTGQLFSGKPRLGETERARRGAGGRALPAPTQSRSRWNSRVPLSRSASPYVFA